MAYPGLQVPGAPVPILTAAVRPQTAGWAMGAVVAWVWGLLQGSSVWTSGSHHTWGADGTVRPSAWLCSHYDNPCCQALPGFLLHRLVHLIRVTTQLYTGESEDLGEI